MLFNGKSGHKWVVRSSGRPTDKREKERPNGPQPYIYNMYRDRPECRYAIYIICIVRDSDHRRPTIPLRPQPYTITDKT